MSEALLGYVFLVTALVFNATANILMKLGARRLDGLEGLSPVDKIWALATNPFLVIGIVLFASNVLFYIVALKRINLSVAYPIMASGGVLVIAAFSVFYLRETLHLFQMVGVGCIAVGIFLVAYYVEG